MHVHHPVNTGEVVSPYSVEKLTPPVYPTWLARQGMQQVELSRGEVKRFTTLGNTSA